MTPQKNTEIGRKKCGIQALPENLQFISLILWYFHLYFNGFPMDERFSPLTLT